MKCKLCNRETKKLANSHIIPKALCKGVAGNKGILISNEEEYTKRSPIGIYDQILCSECEALFNLWDDYAINFFKVRLKQLSEAKIKQEFILIKDYDYSKLKLFFLSLLWKADACKHPMYDSVNVGDQHRKQLASMILEKTPGTIQDYTIILWFGVGGDDVKFIVRPYKNRIERVWFYIFHIAGLDIGIKCSNIKLEDRLGQFLSEDKPIRIYLQEFKETHWYKNAVSAVKKRKNPF